MKQSHLIRPPQTRILHHSHNTIINKLSSGLMLSNLNGHLRKCQNEVYAYLACHPFLCGPFGEYEKRFSLRQIVGIMFFTHR